MLRVYFMPKWLGLPLLALLLSSMPAQAQSGTTANGVPPIDYDSILRQEGYLLPPAAIERVVRAPRHMDVTLRNVSPDYNYFVRTEGESMPRLEDFGKPHYNLAGFQVDPAANRARTLTSRGSTGITLITAKDARRITVQVPANAKVSSVQWSPDGKRLAFLAHLPNATHIYYVANPANGRTTQLTRTPLMATHVSTFRWAADSEHVIAVLKTSPNASPPPAPAVAGTPLVRVAGPQPNRTRTFFSLLETPYDMDLLEFYSTGQLARINVNNGRVTNIGEPAMIRSLNPAPDGEYFRVTTLDRPFSYTVQLGSFASKEAVWDSRGETLLTFSERGLRDGSIAPPPRDTADRPAPRDTAAAADTAKRSLGWRPDGPGFTFIRRIPAPPGEARQQEQSARAQAAGQQQRQQPPARGQAAGQQPQQPRRPDQVIHWLPPFDDNSMEVVYTNDAPIGSVRYSDDGRILFITEGTGNQSHLFAVVLDEPETKHTITRGTGRSITTMSGSRGQTVVRLSPDGQHVFLTGTTRQTREEEEPDPADPPREERDQPAARPYMMKMHIKTGDTTRIYEASGDQYEQLGDILNPEVTDIILIRETPTVPANFYYKNLLTGEERQLTNNFDHVPELQLRQTRTYLARRADGHDIRVRIHLPINYEAGLRYPAMFWFYPREYSDTAVYARTIRGTTIGAPTTSSNRFRGPPGVGSIQLLTLLGYAVVEPDCPIFGAEGRMNDNYVHDLRMNLGAVIDELDLRGYIDRHRLGIGGHSYGGFSTMNALAHTPYFKAGISGAGASNRTFTPNGFQSERRMLWDARETYLGMSPFLYANQITGALLMYHGQIDQNVGTNPINSERMFHAMMGMGKDVALYVYPYEDHGQATLETRLDMWARWIAWLDKHVKYAELPER